MTTSPAIANTIRALPNDLDAETVVLGAMMLDPAAIGKVQDGLAPADFFRPANATICRAIFELAAKHGNAEVAAVQVHLRQAGLLDKVGGPDYLGSIVDGTPGSSAVEHYIGVVRETATARRLIGLCGDTLGKAYEPGQDVADLLSTFQAAAYNLALHQNGKGGAVHVSDAMHRLLDNMDQVYRGIKPPGLRTGFPNLDYLLGGFRAGELVVIAGDTSIGKSAFAGNMAMNVAEDGRLALIVTAEMSDEQYTARFLAAKGRIAGHKIRCANLLHVNDWTMINAAAGEIEGRAIYIDERSTTIEDIALQARQVSVKAGRPVDLLVIDYLQLMNCDHGQGRNESRATKVGQFARRAKVLASDLHCPILLLSQLNREGFKSARASEPPNKHHLKESGDIENHSSVILLLHRRQDDPEVWLQIAKSRDGWTNPWEGPGALRLNWEPQYTLFTDTMHVPPANDGHAGY